MKAILILTAVLASVLMFFVPAGMLQVVFWAGLVLVFLKVAGEGHS